MPRAAPSARNNRQRRIRAWLTNDKSRARPSLPDRIAALAETSPTDKSSVSLRGKKRKKKKEKSCLAVDRLSKIVKNEIAFPRTFRGTIEEGGAFGSFSVAPNVFVNEERTCARARLRVCVCVRLGDAPVRANQRARAVDRLRFFVLGARLRALVECTREERGRFNPRASLRGCDDEQKKLGGKERARTGILKLSTRRTRPTRIYRESL